MKRIADYDIVSSLGKGSAGEVWLCQAPSRLGAPQPQAAVKLLDQSVGSAEFSHVADELKLHAAAESPYLVQLYECGYWNHRVYIAMEYAPGGSLAAADGLDRATTTGAVAAAARGAHALHEQGVVHRSIKPSNILLDGGAKLSNPGLSHVMSPGQTVTGVGAIGTVEFMEQGVVRGEQAKRASDIWSLGACLHHVLTGASVYGADPPTKNLLAMLRHVLAAAPEVSADLEEPWAAIVNRCVAPDRADRYPTAEALAVDIEQAQGQVTQ